MRNLKKVLAIVLSFALVLSLGASAFAFDAEDVYADWDDVGADFKDAIIRLSVHDNGLNVFQGNKVGDDLKFGPKDVLPRAQLVAMAAIVDKGGNPDNVSLNELFASDYARGQAFSDVEKDGNWDWAVGAINYAARMGYVEGEGGGTFNPGADMTDDMVYSMMLSLLGFAAEDKNGAGWEVKVNQLINTYGLRDIRTVTNRDGVTRQELALVLSKTVEQDMYMRDGTNATYTKTGKTLLEARFGDPSDANAKTIRGKVISTKYGSLVNADIFPHNNVVILDRDGTVHQIVAPPDAAVPTKFLGREVTLSVVPTGSTTGALGWQYHRVATGKTAQPVWTNDIFAVPPEDHQLLRSILTSPWYNLASSIRPIRGSYLGYRGSTNGGFLSGDNNNIWNMDWTDYAAGGLANYAYAVRDPNTNFVSEAFYLNYIALRVKEVYRDGTALFAWLDGCDFARLTLADIEFGTTAKKDDIVVAVQKPNADGTALIKDIVSLEVIEGKDGRRCSIHSTCFVIDGAHSSVVSKLTGGISGDWSTVCTWQAAHPTFSFMPVYGIINQNTIPGQGWSEKFAGVNGVFFSSCFDKPDSWGAGSGKITALIDHPCKHRLDLVVARDGNTVTVTGATDVDNVRISVFPVAPNFDTGINNAAIDRLIANTSDVLGKLWGDGTAAWEDNGAERWTNAKWAPAAGVTHYIVAVEVDSAGKIINRGILETSTAAATVNASVDNTANLTVAAMTELTAAIIWGNQGSTSISTITWVRTTGAGVGGSLVAGDWSVSGTTLTIPAATYAKISAAAFSGVGEALIATDVITFTVTFNNGVVDTFTTTCD